MAGGVGCRTVDFRGVFAREGAAAVCAVASVGVDDDFAAGEAGVAVGAADDKLTCGVDVEFEFTFEQVTQTFGQRGDGAGNEHAAHIIFDLLHHTAVGLLLR